jgi:SagB-type dehydrogenase family enzyme
MFALEYHETTKHQFNRFAQSAGYLDWATQPNPFRRFDGARVTELPREAVTPDLPYDGLFEGVPVAQPIDIESIADLLRCSMGLSAWKQYQRSRWALRVNPSSGNLHPTEAYIVWGGGLHHYAPREHTLEERCRLREALPHEPVPADDEVVLVGLTSIFWREAWKYGERAFRYCQHDVGHAIGALRLAAARLGWSLALLGCSDGDIAALLGLDRDDDFREAEREAPECLMLASRGQGASIDVAALAARAQEGAWSGVANQLSPAHRYWTVIDDVARSTDRSDRLPAEAAAGSLYRAKAGSDRSDRSGRSERSGRSSRSGSEDLPAVAAAGSVSRAKAGSARSIILQRRSAVAFDGRSTLPAAIFRAMLDRLRPGASPWDAIDWPPQVHLAIFVHRVDGLVPGLYAFLRDAAVLDDWRRAMRPDFLWEPVRLKPDTTYAPNDSNVNVPNAANGERSERPNVPNDPDDLFLLLPHDLTWPAARVSCDQDIAGDGFFSLGMIARFEPALREYGEWFYRRLFWECGLIGQVLYLEAEAAGARATGIGCFYDDPVHELLGLSGRDWQSLYHFSMGIPVEDGRLTSEAGYVWETA